MSKRAGLIGLLTAEALSITGTRLSMVALPWFVLHNMGSPALAGIVVFAEMAPYVATKLFGGPLVDRIGTVTTSVGGDALSLLVVGAIPVLHLAHALPVPVLLLLVAMAGTFRGPADSAKQVLLPALATRTGTPLERAAGLHDSVFRLGSMLGAPLAGVLIALTDAANVLVLDAVSFGVAALIIGVVVPPNTATVECSDDGYLAEIKAGWAFVRADKLLRAIVVMVSVTNLLDAAFAPVLITVWASTGGGSASALGIVLGVFSAGAVFAALVASAWGHRLSRHRAYKWGFLLCGASRFAVLALPVPLWVTITVFTLSGFGAGFLNPFISAAEYERVPAAMQARVFGLITGLAFVGIPFGSLLAGFGVTWFGLVAMLLICGAAYLVMTLAPFLRPVWRQLDRSTEQRDPTPARGTIAA